MAGLPLPAHVAVLLALAVLGVWVCGRTAAELADPDPAAIVWDEVVGFLTAVTAAPPGWGWVLAAFLLFRFFDIVKPWPVRAAERARGGLGILLDDLVAGILALVVVQLAAWLLAGLDVRGG